MDKKWLVFGATLASIALLTPGCKQENRFLGRTVSAWMIELDSDVDYERRAACEALQLAGPEAAPAIPKLIKLLDDVNDGVSAFCATALIKIGPSAVAPLEGVLAEAVEPNLRLHAATALVRIDSKHTGGRKALMSAFTGVGNAKIADKAAEVIVKEKGALVDLLIGGLDDQFEPVRLRSAVSLRKIGKPAVGAANSLIKVAQAKAGSVELRRSALSALASVAAKDKVEPVLTALVDDESEDENVQAQAGYLLRYIGTRKAVTGFEGEEGAEGDAAAAAQAQ